MDQGDDVRIMIEDEGMIAGDEFGCREKRCPVRGRRGKELVKIYNIYAWRYVMVLYEYEIWSQEERVCN